MLRHSASQCVASDKSFKQTWLTLLWTSDDVEVEVFMRLEESINKFAA